jgi:squalene cyclase
MRTHICLLVLGCFSLAATSASGQVPDKYKPAIKKGLDWLVKQQNADGTWMTQGQHPVSLTAFAGLALLMEGSTTSKGDHAEQLRKASAWLVKRTGDNGLIGDMKNPSEQGRYIFGQGYAMLFLACVYAEEEDRERRLALKDTLQRAIRYAAAAQATSGGWFYTSKQDGGDNDEGATTLSQLQGLRAARAAGIPVPKATLKKALDYLTLNTSPKGGVYYSSRSKGAERNPLTAAAIAAAYSPSDYNKDIVKKWIKFTQVNSPFANQARAGHDEFTHFYLAQVLYAMGEKGFDKLFPNEQSNWQWSKYRESVFDRLLKLQAEEGSWNSGSWGVGPIYATALNLIVMQMDNDAVPFLSAKGE